MKVWKCTVCGYKHKGDEPPEKCPVCGADKSKFIDVTAEEAPPPPAPPKPEPEAPLSRREKLLLKLSGPMGKFHAHPIAVHIPNGVLPLSVLFIILAMVFKCPAFDTAAFVNMFFVLVTMPLVIFTGYVDWRFRYNSTQSAVFMTKIACAIIVTILAGFLVLWRTFVPNVLSPEYGGRFAYVFVHFAMLAAATVAGFLGGKVVFKD